MKQLRPVFIASFFFSLHLALLAYLNASMLATFARSATVSIVYTISSALSLVLVFAAPKLIKRIGLYRFSIGALSLSALLLCIVSLLHTEVILVLFALYFSLNTVIAYAFDLYVEHYSAVRSTGNIRGLFLTLNNIGWVLAPAISGIVVAGGGFSLVYSIAALIIFGAILIIRKTQKNFKDRAYEKTSFRHAFTEIKGDIDVRRIIAIHFVLQFFFSWMVLYATTHIQNTTHFNWQTIGILLSIMLLPFVLFQIPAGRLMDKMGEKPFIVFGFLVMASSTAVFSFFDHAPFISYAIALFCTRVGASIVEVGAESYFFKRVTDSQTGVISIFRTMLPVAYIIGPMLAGAVLIFATTSNLFFMLGISLLIAALYSLRLRNLERRKVLPLCTMIPSATRSAKALITLSCSNSNTDNFFCSIAECATRYFKIAPRTSLFDPLSADCFVYCLLLLCTTLPERFKCEP